MLITLRAVFLALVFLFARSAFADVTIEQWREELRAARTLAENDAPKAYDEARRLQANQPAQSTPADQARALNVLARTELYMALTEQTDQHARAALELAREQKDRPGQAEANLVLALNTVNQGRIDAMITATTDALAALDGVDEPEMLSEALLRASLMYRRGGQLEEQVATAVHTMELARQSHDPMVLAYAHQAMGVAFAQSNRFLEAREHFLAMREAARAVPSKLLEAQALEGLANAAESLSGAEESRALFEESLALCRATRAPFFTIHATFALAFALQSHGDYKQARTLFAETEDLYRQYANPVGLWYALNAMSSIYESMGQMDLAQSKAEEGLRIARDVGFPLYESGSDLRLASIAAARHQYDRAYELMQDAREREAKASSKKASTQVVELARRYEAEAKQRRIDELTRSNQQQEVELQQRRLQQRLLWTVLGGSIAMLVVTAFFLLRLRRTNRMLEAAEIDRQAHLRFLQGLDRVNRAIQQADDVDQMMRDSLDAVLAIFESDRAYLSYPCDPEAESWHVPMERTTPAYPGIAVQGLAVQMSDEFSSVCRSLLDAGGPIQRSIKNNERPLFHKSGVEQFNVRSYLATALHPRLGKPWQFGVQQCSRARTWSESEVQLFNEIGRRLSDGLTGLLSRRDLQDSEARLRKQTEILQSILDSMGDGVCVADEQGEFVLVNPAAERIVGIPISTGEPVGWSKKYGLLRTDQLTEYPAEEVPLARAMRGESCDGVEMFVRNAALPEGRYLSVTARPMKDRNGEVRGGVVVFSDISSRKLAEEEVRALNVTLEQRVLARTAELRQQTRYLRALIDTLPLIVWLKDTESRYLAVNQANANACGRTVEEMVGKSDPELWPRELADRYQADDAEVMVTRLRKTVEEQLADVNGTIWIETFKAPVIDEDGTVLGTVGAARDISERKAADVAREHALAEAQRLARLRSEFLAQMSHELRTPLNAILGYAQILRREKSLTERQMKGLTTIQDSGQHLLTLINDILDLSRIEAARLDLYPNDINFAAFLRVVADIVRVKADPKDLLFSYEPADNLPPTVRVDDKRLRQVLLNLLGNAIKFTERGHVTLRVHRLHIKSDSVPPGNGSGAEMARVRFEIEDTGIGMSEDQLARIFRPFEQVADIRHREGGVGLGLAISRELVRLMGGDIKVQSRPDEGSLFSFELDLPASDIQATAVPVGRMVKGYEGPRLNVLVVDDVEQSRSMLADALMALGFEVSQAANGQECLDRIGSLKPDLIMMDLMMPVLDGLEATRRIRQMPEFRNLPIIAVSASVSKKDESGSYEAGASAFMSKPIEHDILLKILAEQLAVSWVYESPPTESAEGPAPDANHHVPPPPDEMEVLYRLARAGNMRDIRERADHIRQLGPQYLSFATRLHALAEAYQSQAILTFVEKHRGR